MSAREYNEIERDLTRIRTISQKKEHENMEFRSFLKGECSARRLDSLVHRLYEEIKAEIDCTACANCCQKIRPVLDQGEIKRFARGLGISPKELIDQYVQKDEECLTFGNAPCPFLRENRCINYEARPKDCKSYPHLHKNDTLSRLMGVVANCGICPIVFNVYEGLKQTLWPRGRMR
ncbi:MAG: YkgJ family cysteine cluster protein [Syntrophales bacterium]|nr:YkgJ family cysteine cluster protein [Syntrophales bacterium]